MFVLPEDQQHLRGLVDQFFLGNPGKDYKAISVCLSQSFGVLNTLMSS